MYPSPHDALFPETRFVGSKSRVLPFLLEKLRDLPFRSVLDAFSGSGCVAHALKHQGKQVITSDLLHCCCHIARASVENSHCTLSPRDIGLLVQPHPAAADFIRRTYAGVFFCEEDCEFLDHLLANLGGMNHSYKRSLALASAMRACLKKRPRGLFTVTGRKGWDNRPDLRLSLRDHFLNGIQAFNAAVFDNHFIHSAHQGDIFNLEIPPVDLVYIDPPYVSPYSDCDYTRRYHFVEGFSRNWEGLEICYETLTRKFASYPTPFSSRRTVIPAFAQLFERFRESILVVSYSSHAIPGRDKMVELLKAVKKEVRVYSTPLRYCHGTQHQRIDDNHNQVLEYLYVGR